MMKSTELTKISVGSTVTFDQDVFRVLNINDKDVMLVQLDTDTLNVVRFSPTHFHYRVDNGDIVEIEFENNKIPTELLTEEEKKEAVEKAEMIECMLQKMYPEWDRIQLREPKPEMDELRKKLERSPKSTLRLVRRYLQSGRDWHSVIDGRKGEKNRKNTYTIGSKLRGHGTSKVENDEELLSRFEDGFEYFSKNKENGGTVASAYRYMLGKYYMITAYEGDQLIRKLLPEDRIPSYKRFLTYCSQKCGDLTIAEFKMNARERRNNIRLLHGNARSGCYAPGQIVEVDEVEIDMINVASDVSGGVVGRAVMYLAVDVYSHCIVGWYVDYENNSFIGLTNLLMSFLEDPQNRFARYGISLPDQICPAGFLPSELRTDHGAEYTSSDVRRLGRETGINLSLVAPGTGSLKGLVEQAFHQFQEKLRGSAEGTGIIQKKYASKHYETACVNIDDVRRIVCEFILYFNQHVREGFSQTRGMLEAGVPPIPAAIWKYGCEHVASPRWITKEAREQIMFSFMKTDRTFKVSRRGITYRGLFFENSDEWLMLKMKEAGNRSLKLDGVRYDPRSVKSIFMMVDGVVREIPLNAVREEQMTFRDMTWKAYDELYAKRNSMIKSLRGNEIELSVNTQKNIADVIETSKRLQEPKRNRKKNIRENLRAEKARLAEEGSITNRLLTDVQEDEDRYFIPENPQEITSDLPIQNSVDEQIPVNETDDFNDARRFFGL